MIIDSTHIHPFLVHFPIALVVIGFVFEILSVTIQKNDLYKWFSYYLLVLGSITAILAQLSGLFLTNHPKGGELFKVFEQHENYALVSVILLISTTVSGTIILMKKLEHSKIRFIFTAFYFLSLLTIVYTGFLGGTMIYEYMMSL